MICLGSHLACQSQVREMQHSSKVEKHREGAERQDTSFGCLVSQSCSLLLSLYKSRVLPTAP